MGFGLSLGQYDYNNAPWLRPATPSIDTSMPWSNMSMFNNVPAWGGVPSWNGGVPSWNSAPAWNSAPSYDGVPNSSAGSSAPETFEQRKARLDKQRQQVIELNEAKQEATKTLDEVDTQVQEIEKGKQEDGSAKVVMSAKDYRKNVSWGKRILRGLGNAAEGALKMVKSLAGFDKDGKWNPIKCATNVALLVGSAVVAIACPATIPAMMYIGLGAGVIQTGVGIINNCTAKTVEDIDNSWQDIGAGIATFLASRSGIKGMGKAAGIEVSGINFFKNAGALIKSQPKNVFSSGWAGKSFWSRVKSNFKEVNPFKSRTSKKLNKAEQEYNQCISGISDSSLSEAEQLNMLNRGVRLESEIAQLKQQRVNEIVDSPLSWINKKNRRFVNDEIGKSVAKEYWTKNTAGKGLVGKSWFVTKKAGMVGLNMMAPQYLLWNLVANNSSVILLRFIDFVFGTQYYGEGLCNSFVAPEAITKLSAEDVKTLTAELNAQKEQIQKEINSINKKTIELSRA